MVKYSEKHSDCMRPMERRWAIGLGKLKVRMTDLLRGKSMVKPMERYWGYNLNLEIPKEKLMGKKMVIVTAKQREKETG